MTVGCGDVSLDVAASRGVDRREVERALTSALELGLSTVDVRPEADAERLVGDAVRALRVRDRVTTIVRVPALAGRDTPIDRLPARYVQERVEAALRHTRLDALPLALLAVRPTWTHSKAWPELVGTAARLVREGKVLAWGADLFPTDTNLAVPRADDDERDDDEPADAVAPFRDLFAEPWFSAIALTYSICHRAARPLIDAALAPPIYGPRAPEPTDTAPGSLILSPFAITAPEKKRARASGPTQTLSVYVRHPLAGGALAGGLGPGRKLSPRDDRELDARQLERTALLAATLAPLARNVPPAAYATDQSRAYVSSHPRREDATSTSVAELALRYVLDTGAIALPRLHRHEHVTDALIASSSDPLPPAITAILDGLSLDT